MLYAIVLSLSIPATDVEDVSIALAEMAASWIAMNAIHESAHYGMAKGVGFDVDEFKPTYTLYDGKLQRPYVAYHYKYSDPEYKHLMVAGSGMLATRLTAELVDGMGNRVENKRIQQATAAMYFVSRLDSMTYISICAVNSWSNRRTGSMDDPQAIVGYFAHDKRDQKALFTLLIGAVVLDALIDMDEIKTNWSRLLMN